MERSNAYDRDDRFKAYFHELISMIPWLGPHITKRSNQGSALKMVKYARVTITIKVGYSPGNMMDDQMKLFTGGVTT